MLKQMKTQNVEEGGGREEGKPKENGKMNKGMVKIENENQIKKECVKKRRNRVYIYICGCSV